MTGTHSIRRTRSAAQKSAVANESNIMQRTGLKEILGAMGGRRNGPRSGIFFFKKLEKTQVYLLLLLRWCGVVKKKKNAR